MVFGTTNLSFGPALLPYDLSLIGMPGGRLDCSTDVALPVPVAGSAASFSLTIPSTIHGATFWNQAFGPDAAATNLGRAVMSNSCRGQIHP